MLEMFGSSLFCREGRKSRLVAPERDCPGLLHDPDLVLLDEPFAGLDERTSRMLGEYLADLKETGITLAMTSHSLKSAGLIHDREITLEKGSIVQDVRYAA
jgi:ABC-type multidrug transport system ATPase subunit